MAPVPHMIWRPQSSSYCAMVAFSGLIATWMPEISSATPKIYDKSDISHGYISTLIFSDSFGGL